MALNKVEIENLIGLSEKDAIKTIESAKMQYRIIQRDAEKFIGTSEVNINRIKLTLQKGKVKKARIG